jgi:hypothetical protein
MANKIVMSATLVMALLAVGFAATWTKPTATGVDHSDAAIERRHQRYLEREREKALAPAVADSSRITTQVSKMSFEGCLLVIQRTAAEVGVAPVNIIETPRVRIVRFKAKDGSVLVSCGGGEMALTKSPHH